MDFNRKTLAGATSAALVASMAGGMVASANAADSLVGAGSSLVAPLMANWATDYNKKTGTSVTYGAVGSGAGIAQITARSVDFGASDAPLSADQAAACNGCVQIPWALTATAIGFNIPGVTKLQLTGPILAAIYEGKITNWNDSRIAKINKGQKFPNLAITPGFRSDGSGDTYAFTDYMSRVDKTWKKTVGYGTQVSFPTGVGGKGNAGLTAVITSTPGAIGYVSAAYLIEHNVRGAALQNAAKKFVYPNLRNISAAGKLVKKVPANNEMHIVNPPKGLKQAYPLSTFTYIIVPTSSPKAAAIKQFVTYAISSQGQSFGPALDFAPIPKVVIAASKKTLKKIK